jgi:hypothetical protein
VSTDASRGRKWAVLAALVAVTVAIFGEGPLRRRVLFEKDIHLVWHPQVSVFVRAVTEGSWPYWDRFTAFGQPLLANPSCVALFYPPTWLHLIVPPAAYYTFGVLLHAALSGAGMYRLARAIPLSRTAACLSASLWLATGPVPSLVSYWNHFLGAAWMPWTLLAALVAVRRPTARAGILWGLALAIQVLAGSGDFAILTGLVTAAFAVAALWTSARTRRAVFLTSGLAGLVGVGLSAAQWLPTLGMARRGARGFAGADAATFWSLHPATLAQTLLPVSFVSSPGADPLSGKGHGPGQPRLGYRSRPRAGAADRGRT